MSKDTYHPVTQYPVTEYRCGARAGDGVRLRREIGSYAAGEIWCVPSGAAAEPIVIWLRQADVATHTWSDDEEFLQTFEILPRDPT